MQTDVTPYADINELLGQLLAEMQNILGEKLVGLYLYGSLVTGDFERGSSDIDLLAVMSSDIDERDVGVLQHMHHEFADGHQEWDGRIEVAYLSVVALKTFKLCRSKIAIISPGEPFHVKEAGNDWLLNWYTVREKGMALLGPPPMFFIEFISKEECRDAVRAYVKLWNEWIPERLKRRPGQAYAILTMCRALYTLKKDEQVSKKRAALWAQEEFPEWAPLIRNALVWREAWRDGQVDHEVTLVETVEFVRFAIEECEERGGGFEDSFQL